MERVGESSGGGHRGKAGTNPANSHATILPAAAIFSPHSSLAACTGDTQVSETQALASWNLI